MKENHFKKLIHIMLFFSLFGFVGCETNNCCTNIDVDLTVHYQTQSGENLIGSDQDFDESNIKLYYKNGAEYDYMYNGNLDNPNYYDLYEENNKKLMRVFPSYYYEGNRSITLIELNDDIVDTLVCEFELSNNNELLRKAWLNGVEMNDRLIEIKK